MSKTINISLQILILLIWLGCGGSKDDIMLEDETAESLVQKSEVAYNNGNYEESMKLANLMLDNFPTSDLHIDAQLLMARTLGAQEKYEDQFDLLLRILKENIIPEKVPTIYSQIGEFYENSAKWNPGTVTSDSVDFRKAAEFYKKAVFYPNSQDSVVKSMSLYRMALMHAKLNEVETASKAYQEIINTYPESPYSSLARIKLSDPTNTSELPLPTSAPEQVAQPELLQPEAPVQPPPEETLPVVQEEQPGQIELPAEETEESSILDSLQTIDSDDVPEQEDE